jgi:dipeptidyl aminopeptidase/acylaminoacyl peptidase
VRRSRVARAAGTGVVLAAALYAAVSYVMASGLTQAKRVALKENPAEYGDVYQDVTFPSRGDDVELSGWFMPPQAPDTAGARAEGDPPAVVFVHGLDANREMDGALELTARLARRGFAVLSFDLRAHGASGPGRVTGGQEEQRDALGAVDYLRSRGYGAHGVGLIGFSMGAAIAILAAAEEPAVRAVVADSPFADVRDMIAPEAARKSILPQAIIPFFVPGLSYMASHRLGIHLDRLVPEKAVRRLDYPVFVIHGTADTRIPYQEGVRVHQASGGGPDDLWLVPGADHVEAFRQHKKEYLDRVERYLRARLADGAG